ncbi:MAG: NADH-quinone oxidoreductase subunit B/C/D [Desulfobacterales bacterium]|nr:NADH-quinone oxidoreductase subunit B/C/D [Desulfobacterales bacterium]MBS3755066.1 NADH-quinone oxidoreductase subunit B/C/D [Desulfobacterales bacterium]
MGRKNKDRIGRSAGLLDPIINWAHSRSLWPMYFGLSCCFVEESTALTPRYDLARFGAEVLRLSPRQADLLIISGTVFKKAAPMILRVFEQMAEPRWVISMGSCANTGGMYDVYSVVQGINQILPVDVYIPGCPPRPEAVLAGITELQRKIGEEKPARKVFGLGGGSQGSAGPALADGHTKSRDTRGPGMNGIAVRGDSVSPPEFFDSRADLMWTPPARGIYLPDAAEDIIVQVRSRFGDGIRAAENPSDMLTLHVPESRVRDVLRYLKKTAAPRFERLEDYTAVDESARRHRDQYPDFTLVFTLLCFDPPMRMRIKVALFGEYPETATISDIWPAANWYEREIYDMFGIRFSGHSDLRRLIMPPDWSGHPLRKTYPDRATEMDPYTFRDAHARQPRAGEKYFDPDADEHAMVLNIGPHHTATHGLLRLIVRLEGEIITGLNLDVGFHHRGVEKMGERQTWLQFIPYTDRVDYMAGAANNLPYIMAVEQLADIVVPERARHIRVLMSELFRISNHLAYLGIMAHDLGAMTPNFYTFRDREMVLDIVEMISGARLHPSWFRPGGVAADMPAGWKPPVRDLLRRLPKTLKDIEKLTLKNPIFKARTKGLGVLRRDEAIDWGVTGPNLRACGMDWDLRKKMPYSGYEQFDFEVPIHTDGDNWARYKMRIEECRQSLRIIRQILDGMPEGRYVTADYRYCVPERKDMLNDIESLIHHFVNVTRGPRMPRGDSYAACEIPRGEQGYYAVSDGLGAAYRMRVRGPSFTNVQVFEQMTRGESLADLVAVLGSTDYTLPDLDR